MYLHPDCAAVFARAECCAEDRPVPGRCSTRGCLGRGRARTAADQTANAA
jgi:hypothetical protein